MCLVFLVPRRSVPTSMVHPEFTHPQLKRKPQRSEARTLFLCCRHFRTLCTPGQHRLTFFAFAATLRSTLKPCPHTYTHEHPPAWILPNCKCLVWRITDPAVDATVLCKRSTSFVCTTRYQEKRGAREGGRELQRRSIVDPIFLIVYAHLHSHKTGGYTTLLLFKETTVDDICKKIRDKFYYRDNTGLGLFFMKDESGIALKSGTQVEEIAANR